MVLSLFIIREKVLDMIWWINRKTNKVQWGCVGVGPCTCRIESVGWSIACGHVKGDIGGAIGLSGHEYR